MAKKNKISLGATLDQEKDRILSDLKDKTVSQNLFSIKEGSWNSENLNDHLELYFQYFRQALEMRDPSLFSEFLLWAKSVQESRNPEGAEMPELNDIFRDLIADRINSDYAEKTLSFFEEGVALSEKKSADFSESYLDANNELGGMAKKYFQYLLDGDRKQAATLVLDAVDEGISVKDIYMHVFQPCQYEIGRLWQLNKLTVAQEHFCTAATQMVMSQLYPHIFSNTRINKSVVAVTLGGQLHEIGIRMVSDFFEMEGWDTFYLGANCPSNEIIEELIEREADLLALSVTMASSLDEAMELIKRMKKHDQLKKCKVIVGGRPFQFSEELWKSLGADGFAKNAEEALEIANKVVGD